MERRWTLFYYVKGLEGPHQKMFYVSDDTESCKLGYVVLNDLKDQMPKTHFNFAHQGLLKRKPQVNQRRTKMELPSFKLSCKLFAAKCKVQLSSNASTF